MTIRLYFDEDSSRHSLARELRFRGADVITAIEAGMVGRADEQQLEWTASNGRALYSFNRGDFYSLHTTWLCEGRHLRASSSRDRACLWANRCGACCASPAPSQQKKCGTESNFSAAGAQACDL